MRLSLISVLTISLILSSCVSKTAKILKVQTPQMPLTRVTLFFPFGSADEKVGEEGSTLLVTRWMGSGSEKHPSMNSMEQAYMSFGATVTTRIYPQFTIVSVESPSDTFLQSWKLALEEVRQPNFAEADLQTVRTGSIAMKRSVLSTWHLAGRQLATAAIYAGTKEASAEVGTEAGLNSLSGDRLKTIYKETFKKGPAAILATQSISLATENEIVQSVANWSSSFSPSKIKPVQPKGRNIILIDRPGSTQAYLFFAKAGPAPGTEDHALAAIGTQILGSNGGNSSILYDELRAKRGLTYHASMQLSKVPNRQVFIGATFGSNEKLGELAHLYVAEWEKFYNRHDTSLADLQQADFAYRSMRARESETISDQMKTAAETFSVTGDIKTIWVTPVITEEKFEAAKAKWLSPKDFTLVVLGDKDKVKEILEKAIGPVGKTKILPEESDWDAVSQAVKELL